jgi:diguanylate cyclase (GGDEF)-like protein
VSLFYGVYHLLYGNLWISSCAFIAALAAFVVIVSTVQKRSVPELYAVFFLAQAAALALTSYHFGARGLIVVFPIINGLCFVFRARYAWIYSSGFVALCLSAAYPSMDPIMLLRFGIAFALTLVFAISFTSTQEHYSNQLDYIANHDALTQLPNRRGFLAWLRSELPDARAQRDELALIYCDLDHFKQINDRYGHETGDKVLQAFSRRLVTSFRADELCLDEKKVAKNIARMAGDEFVAAIRGKFDEHQLQKIGERILNNFVEPVTVGETELQLQVSVGVAFASAADFIAFKLLDSADKAMYEAKQTGKNRVVIRPARAGFIDRDDCERYANNRPS